MILNVSKGGIFILPRVKLLLFLRGHEYSFGLKVGNLNLKREVLKELAK
jgi:hypothetical protein